MNLSHIEPLDINDPTSVEDWHERFDAYVLTNDKIDDKNKTAFCTTLIGKDDYKLLKTLLWHTLIQ